MVFNAVNVTVAGSDNFRFFGRDAQSGSYQQRANAAARSMNGWSCWRRLGVLAALPWALMLANVVATQTAFAQGQTLGALRGTAHDQQGAVLPGVLVTLTPASGVQPLTTVTDKAGFYVLSELQPGDYTLKAELPGFGTLVQPNVTARAGLNMALDITLNVGALDEVVVVRRDAPVLESRTATQAVNVSGDFQRSLPLTGRRYWHDFLGMMPGTVSSELGLQPFIVHGANSSSNILQLDGADVGAARQGSNAYVNFSTEAIEDVQAKLSGVDASSPLGQGAVINLVTKSGTNQLKGAAGIAYQARSWNANNNPGGTATAFAARQTDAALGGPLVRDHLWFFGTYRYRSEDSGISRSADQLATLRALQADFLPFDNRTRAHYPFVKVTARMSEIHRAEAFFQRDRYPLLMNSITDAGPFSQRSYGGDAVSGRLTSLWGTHLTTRIGVTYNNKTFATVQVGSGPSTPVHANVFLSGGRLVGTGTIATLNNAAQAADTADSRWGVNADATYVRHGWLGSHEFQFGILSQPDQKVRTIVRYANDGFSQEDRVLVDPANASAGTIPFHRRVYDVDALLTSDFTNADSAVYLQDLWRIASRLSLNVGVRVDVVNRHDELFDKTVQRSAEVGPRLGVNYLLRADGRQSLRATWGRIHDLVSGALSGGTVSATVTDLYDTNRDGSFETTFVTPGATTRTPNTIVDRNYHQSFTDEVTFGYRRQFARLISAEANFVHRDFKDQSVSIETNALYDGGRFVGYRDPSLNEIYYLTNNRYNRPVYNALELVISRQAHDLQFLAGYTRQWRHVDGTWLPNDPASIIQPDAFPNNGGLGPEPGSSDSNSLSGTAMTGGSSARDHLLRIALAYRGPWHLTAATSYTYQSRLWVGPTIDRLSSADPTFGPSTVTLSNGRVVSNPLSTLLRFVGPTRSDVQAALPATHIWNVRLGRAVPFGRTRLDVALDVFNLPNAGSEQFYIFGQTNQRFSPNFGKGQQRQLPRSAQLSARIAF